MVRRNARTRLPEITPHHIRVLRRGSALLPMAAAGFYLPDGTLDMAAVQAAWEELSDELLPEFIADHPGTRPAAWWLFDAPEPQRRLLYGHDPDGESRPEWTRRLRFGRPAVFGKSDFADPPCFESQAAYLDRHGLLTDAERDVLGFDYDREEAPLAAWMQ